MIKNSFLCLVAFYLFLTLQLQAITGYEVMKKVHDQDNLLRTKIMKVSMKIIDSKERVRTRFFRLWKKHDQDKNQDISTSMIKFFKPDKVKGTSLRTVSNEGSGVSHQWVYFPALKSLKQLKTEDKNKSFMGSDFNYSDIAGRRLSQDTHTLVVEKKSYYIVQSIPKDNKEQYSKLMFKIDKKNFVVQQVNFYNHKGTKFKSLKNEKFSTVQDVLVAVFSVMENHSSGGRTILEVQDIEANMAIGEDILGFQGLKSF
ncbi:MAG: outer membrane lipoprotein-sorting protein [bacterium]